MNVYKVLIRKSRSDIRHLVLCTSENEIGARKLVSDAFPEWLIISPPEKVFVNMEQPAIIGQMPYEYNVVRP